MTTEISDTDYVYHGSHELFDQVIPKRQIRRGKQREIIFNDISFHATPHKWIALAYTCTHKEIKIDGKITHYTMGVSLYEHDPVLDIYGVGSLEESLQSLYGEGGYLYAFDKKDFFHTQGLGSLEVITKGNPKPLSVERIDDPVSELQKMGVHFEFHSLGVPDKEVAQELKLK